VRQNFFAKRKEVMDKESISSQEPFRLPDFLVGLLSQKLMLLDARQCQYI
jgi:hypothetical protein